MRSVSIIAVLLMHVCAASATVVTLDTAEHYLNIVPATPQSKLTMEIELFGFEPLTFSNIPIYGTVPVDFNLGALNSGTIEANSSLGGSLHLANVSQSFPGISLRGTVETIDVTASLHLGPVNVVNRNFTVTSATPGGLKLDGGTLRFTFTGGGAFGPITSGLGTNVFDVDLADDPIEFLFSNLFSNSFSATTDDDNNGIENDGAELNLPLTGRSFENWITSQMDIVASGNLYLGSNVRLPIPEINALGLASLAACALAGTVAFRRRRRG